MLLCYGGVGTGKTHLLESVAIELHKQGKFARVLTMAAIMANLKRGMGSDEVVSLEDRIDNLSKVPFLLLDDVGMGGSGSVWEWGQLETIIAYRYRENLFTILTTNLDLPEIPERIVSRFKDREKARIVLNEGSDYRPLKKEKK